MAPQERGGQHVEPRPWDVAEEELLHALGGEQADPVPEGVLVPDGVAEVGPQAHGAERARMGEDGARDGVGHGVHVAGVVEDEVDVVEDERVGGPDPPPPGGEHRRACCVLDREEGDDAGEDVVGQPADDVLAAVGVGIGDGGARGRSAGEAGEEPPQARRGAAHGGRNESRGL